MQRKLSATLCAASCWPRASPRPPRRPGTTGSRPARRQARPARRRRHRRPEAARLPDRRAGVGAERRQVRGLSADTALVGIDYRPATGDLYGLGDRGGVYVSTTGRPARRCVAPERAAPGHGFGVDFNPTVDRLRIVSDTGQNLRDNVDAEGTRSSTARSRTPARRRRPPRASQAPPTRTTTPIRTRRRRSSTSTPRSTRSWSSRRRTPDCSRPPASSADAATPAGFDIHSTSGAARPSAWRASRPSPAAAGPAYGIDLITGRAEGLGWFPRRHAVTGIAIPTE